jgi:copper resistance protein C
MKTWFQGFRRVGGLAVFVVFLALFVPNGWAHARLVRSIPADKAELPEAPKEIELWFNELLDSGFNKIEVVTATAVDAKTRKNLCKGEPKVDAKDRTHILIPVEPLEPGEYIIEYRVLSRDGHSAPGRLAFKVRKAN